MKESLRDTGIDSLKGILIILVVFGHMIETMFEEWPFNAIYTFIYSFHMPMFVLISGYVFSLDYNTKKLKRGILRLAETFFVFQLIWTIFNIIVTHEYSFWMLVNPRWTLWYLLSLIYWRIGTFIIFRTIIKSLRNITILLILSTIAALLVGFIPINSDLSFQRTFVFFPFFLLGVLFRSLKKYKNDLIYYKNLAMILFGGGILLIISILYIDNLNLENLKFYFYGNKSYCQDYNLYVRMLCTSVGVIISCLIFLIYPMFDNKVLSVIGINSLNIYLLHTFFVRLISIVCSHGYLQIGIYWYILYTMVTIMLIWIISQSK